MGVPKNYIANMKLSQSAAESSTNVGSDSYLIIIGKSNSCHVARAQKICVIRYLRQFCSTNPRKRTKIVHCCFRSQGKVSIAQNGSSHRVFCAIAVLWLLQGYSSAQSPAADTRQPIEAADGFLQSRGA